MDSGSRSGKELTIWVFGLDIVVKNQFLLTLKRNAIDNITGVTTGHWTVSTHVAIIGIKYNHQWLICDDDKHR